MRYAASLIVFFVAVPLAGLLLVASDVVTTTRQRRWSAILNAAGVFILAGGAVLLASEWVSRNGFGGRPHVIMAFGLSHVAVVALTAWTYARARRSSRDGATGRSVVGWVLFAVPLLPLGGPLVIPAAGVLLVLGSRAETINRGRWRLLTLLSAATARGRSMSTAVDGLLAAGVCRGWVRKRVGNMSAHLASGLTGADAAAAARLFPTAVIDRLRAAEMSGRLPEAMAAIRDHIPASQTETGRRIEHLVTYVFAVQLLTIAVIAFFHYAALDDLIDLSNDFGMPATTLERRSSVVSPGPLIGVMGGLSLLAVAAVVVHRIGPGNLPTRLLRRLPRTVRGPRVLRTLSEPVDAGRPVEPVVRRLAAAAMSEHDLELWAGIGEQLEAGDRLYDALTSEGLLVDADGDRLRASGDVRADVMRVAADEIESRHRLRLLAFASVVTAVQMIATAAGIGLFGHDVITLIREMVAWSA